MTCSRCDGDGKRRKEGKARKEGRCKLGGHGSAYSQLRGCVLVHFFLLLVLLRLLALLVSLHLPLPHLFRTRNGMSMREANCMMDR